MGTRQAIGEPIFSALARPIIAHIVVQVRSGSGISQSQTQMGEKVRAGRSHTLPASVQLMHLSSAVAPELRCGEDRHW